MKDDRNRRQAVALSYLNEQAAAPKVTAKGHGLIAKSIVEKAKEKGVPIQEDPSLVRLLGELDLNETIPEDLYKAVAEVFAFLYKLDKASEGKNSG